MHTYVTAFEIARQSYPAPVGPVIFMAAFFGALVICAAWLWSKRALSEPLKQARFFLTVLAIGLAAITSIMWRMKTGHDQLVETFLNGGAEVAEGAVENFHPMPSSGHDTERFTVAGRQFAYSNYMVTGGFNNAASHGGPIRAGLPVRITYVPGQNGNVIVKLELAPGA